MANVMNALTSPLKIIYETAEKLLQAQNIIEHGDEIRQLHASAVAALKDQATAEQKIQTLEREVADLKANKAKLERYELKRLPPNALVMALKEGERGIETDHYACVKCYGDGEIRPLQSILIHNGIETLRCLKCGSDVKTGYYVPPQPRIARGRDFNVFDP
jgi:hypothetical protein